MSDDHRSSEPHVTDDPADQWAEPVTYSRRRSWGVLPWLIAGILVLALAAGAGYGAAYLVADMNAAPTPRTALPDPTPTPTARRTQQPAPSPTVEAPTPTPTEEPWPTDDPLESPVVEATPREHIVARGESISIIAAEYGVTMEEIIELNELQNPNVIVPGQRLLIPPPSD